MASNNDAAIPPFPPTSFRHYDPSWAAHAPQLAIRPPALPPNAQPPAAARTIRTVRPPSKRSGMDIMLDVDMVLTTSDHPPPVPQRRNRITPAQLGKLERSFRRDTHPTREARKILAEDLKMCVISVLRSSRRALCLRLPSRVPREPKSVTIWFQVCRHAFCVSSPVLIIFSRLQNKRQSAKRDIATAKTASSHTGSQRAVPPPSLERVALQHELPPLRPRSVCDASYHPDHQKHIWGHMLSSPSPSPPPSPSSRHGPTDPSSSSSSVPHPQEKRHPPPPLRPGARITLEWACANAVGHPPSPPPEASVDTEMLILEPPEDDAGMESGTEAGDEHEAITPSEGRSLVAVTIASPAAVHEKGKWEERLALAERASRTVRNAYALHGKADEDSKSSLEQPQPENTRDEIEAALALCGLFGA